PLALRCAKKTRSVAMQNIVFALGTKALILILSVFGITSIWFAIFADVGVALIAILNATRALKVK
ncbi:MAG: heavy metal translocating P-type ATPase, partial [Oscillospiraceae bacterium]|nr:heavy metal translocating P-type ATPase [Oscillospiraceae bacterium]